MDPAPCDRCGEPGEWSARDEQHLCPACKADADEQARECPSCHGCGCGRFGRCSSCGGSGLRKMVTDCA